MNGCIAWWIILVWIEKVSAHQVRLFSVVHVLTLYSLVSINAVVSIAISYVDRVLSICLCPDRRAFKLISSASLHLAIKIHSPWQWKEICPLLPDLSRGDFDSKRIVAMENEMTHWLQWYLNQSTPQCMATYLLSLLKDVPHSVLQNITDTTIFLIEVSVCDYDFVTVRNSIIAIAAVLNATEKVGFDLCDFDNDAFSYRNDFRDQIKDILKDIDYTVNWNEVSLARDRLWSLYRNSTQSSVHQSMLVTAPIAPKRSIIDEGMSSPTSVVVAKRLRSRSDFAFREISIVPSLEFSVSSDSQDPSHVLAGDSHSL